MQASVLISLLVAVNLPGASIPEPVVDKTDETFRQYWDAEFEWNFDALPTEGSVPESRVPYSGYIYPDTAGGCASALRKYDLAFNGRRMLATSHEQWDTTAYRKPQTRRGGLFGLRMVTSMETPHWHGHCNGWSAAAIRHAEPTSSVRYNGVLFSPADIKGLLAEIYIYNDIIEMAGSNYALNAGSLHAIVANWIGRGSHPIAMEADPGEEKWNYPIHGFATSWAKRSNREVEVKLNLAYAKDSRGEFQQSPRYQRIKYFHYMLTLDGEGRIVGGYFFRDSSMIDLLWAPLRPKQGRQAGNERGNPYVDVDKVLEIWRASVPEETRNQWPLIDPPAEDRIADLSGLSGILPRQNPHAVREPAEEEPTASGESDDEVDETANDEAEGEETEVAEAEA